MEHTRSVRVGGGGEKASEWGVWSIQGQLYVYGVCGAYKIIERGVRDTQCH